MAAAALRVERVQTGVRPFDPSRDLKSVVELLTVAFGERLSPAGQVALAEMRRMAHWGVLWWWLWPGWGGKVIAPGFVWVEDGHVVGSVSLRRALERGGFFIGNMAVHPDWQGRGIAKALMKTVLERISARGGRWVGLEVQADNQVARRLYKGLGFQEVGRTLHMMRPAGLPWAGVSPPPSSLRRGRGRDSAALIELVETLVPESQRPLLRLREEDYRPSWDCTVARWLEGRWDSWWVIEEEGVTCGAVRAVHERGRRPDCLEVWVAPEHSGQVEVALVHKGMDSLRSASKKMIETVLPRPTEPLVMALEAVGFRKLHVLVQMRLGLVHRIPVKG